MIQSKNRSYYIGASDTSFVVGNWETKSFEKWFLEKLDLNKNTFNSIYTMAGNNYEHKILESLDIKDLEFDKQILKGRLRVNLDGNTSDTIYEVKTHSKEFKVSKQYWRQAQVEMYASEIKNLYIVSYQLNEEDYNNFFNKIDKERLIYNKIDYDNYFIENEYLPKLNYLSKCLDLGIFPKESDINGKSI